MILAREKTFGGSLARGFPYLDARKPHVDGSNINSTERAKCPPLLAYDDSQIRLTAACPGGNDGYHQAARPPFVPSL